MGFVKPLCAHAEGLRHFDEGSDRAKNMKVVAAADAAHPDWSSPISISTFRGESRAVRWWVCAGDP